MIYLYSTEQTSANSSFYKGLLFEELLRLYLRAAGYEVDVQRRKTASLEYDLHGQHCVDHRPLIGEAKAHAETIGGKELTAFVGKAIPFLVQTPPYSAIFLSASPLSPEAQDYLRNLAEKTQFRIGVKCGLELETHIRAALHLPTADAAIKLTRVLLPVASSQSVVHTDRGTFIAVVGSEVAGAFNDRFVLISKEGTLVSDVSLLHGLKSALPALQELEPVWNARPGPGTDIPSREIPSGLITAVDWLDYRRPAGMDFFIGREKEIARAGDLVDGATRGLVLEIKARSGVGKSSLLSVLAEKWQREGHRVELHDARDVQSSEDVLKLAQRFVGGSKPLNSFEEVGPALHSLQVQLDGKSAVLMVDQFESTFQSPEVYTAYEYLALCISRSEWCVSMVFSRKDDLLTTHDDMLVSLDRMRGLSQSISLEDFSHVEASDLIRQAAQASKDKVGAKVLEQVLEFSQGFPWLLKRTLAHVFGMLASGAKQSELLSSGLHLADLFEEELSELDEQERGYLTRVAAVLPATYQALSRRFDDDPFLRPMLEKLTHRKLLRFSAGTYDTYNDVFKDFLLYERMPEQGQSELVRIGLVSVMSAFRSIGAAKVLDPSELVRSWGKSLPGVYNLLRDMRLAGLVSKPVSGWEVPDVVRQFEHQGRLGEFVRQSVLRNRIVSSLVVELEKVGGMTRADVAVWLRDRFPFVRAHEKVWRQYARTLCDWLVRLKLAESGDEQVRSWRGPADAARTLGNLAVSGRGVRPKGSLFLPARDWTTTQYVWHLIAEGHGNGSELRRAHISARKDLINLGAITEDGEQNFRVLESFEVFEERMVALLKSQPYSEFWELVQTGHSYESAGKTLRGLESLAPATRLALYKKLCNWGRKFGCLPRGFRGITSKGVPH